MSLGNENDDDDCWRALHWSSLDRLVGGTEEVHTHSLPRSKARWTLEDLPCVVILPLSFQLYRAAESVGPSLSPPLIPLAYGTFSFLSEIFSSICDLLPTFITISLPRSFRFPVAPTPKFSKIYILSRVACKRGKDNREGGLFFNVI